MGKKGENSATEKPKHFGRNKKKSGSKGFPKGNEFYKVRMENYKQFDQGTDNAVPLTMRGSSERLKEKSEAKELEDQSCEYFICKKEHMNKLWNQGFRSHYEYDKNCKGLLSLKREQHFIISSTYSLECHDCKFRGTGVKMYDEHLGEGRDPRGRKPSTLNDALGMALLGSSIGVAGITEILLKIGIDPGSQSGLQKLITRCGKKMLAIGEAVIRETREDLAANHSKDVDASLDTCYNNAICSASTPLVAGNQSVTTACEEKSGDRKVIACITASKIGIRQHENDSTIILKAHDNIGCEGLYAEKVAEELKESDMNLETVVSDADCQIAGGVKKTFKDCEFQKDTHHYSNNQWKKIKNSEFSTQMFTHKKLPKFTSLRSKKKIRGFFATDLQLRCTAEFNAAHRKLEKVCSSRAKLKQGMKKILRNVPEAILSCYLGRHTKCKRYSFVCGKFDKLWEKKTLPQELRAKLNMTAGDKSLVLDLAKLRIGDKAVDETYLNLNTQKCEALNRKFRKTNPKNITSTVNFRPRILSSVVDNNLGFEGTSRRILTANHHSVCGIVKKKIKAYQNQRINRKEYHKTYAARKARINKKCRLIEMYQDKTYRSCVKEEYPSYSKGAGIDKSPV